MRIFRLDPLYCCDKAGLLRQIRRAERLPARQPGTTPAASRLAVAGAAPARRGRHTPARSSAIAIAIAAAWPGGMFRSRSMDLRGAFSSRP